MVFQGIPRGDGAYVSTATSGDILWYPRGWRASGAHSTRRLRVSSSVTLNGFNGPLDLTDIHPKLVQEEADLLLGCIRTRRLGYKRQADWV